MKRKLIGLLLVLSMTAALTACGGKKEEPEDVVEAVQEVKEEAPTEAPEPEPEPEPEPTGELMETSRFSFRYDPAVWVYEEDEPEDSDYTSSITMEILDPADPEDYLVWFNLYASKGDLSGFRYDLANHDFDAYEYAVNNAYETVNIGGLDFLYRQEEDNMVYFTRDTASGVNVEIEVDGDLANEAVVALVDSIQFTLEDAGNVDPPWPWEGEPYAVEAGEKAVGSYTLKTEQIPFAEPIVTMETFEHNLAVSGETVYLSTEGSIKEYTFDGSTLTYVKEIDLGDTYEYVDASEYGSFWFSNIVRDLIKWDGESVAAAYPKGNVTAMHPSGNWGVEWGYSGITKVTISGDTAEKETIATPEAENVMHVQVDESGNIYVAGSAADKSGHKVFVYDSNGTLKTTLMDENGEGMGSVTFATKTSNGYLALDGNMRYLYLYDNSGAYVGHCTFNELFGTDYPWPCDAVVLEDGSILCLMTDERPDESSDEVVAFKLSGF